MVEYDFVAADKKRDEAAADSSNYVLCKVYRSPHAKGKPASASSSSKNASSKQTAKKRKAAGCDHPEAPPAKSFQQQEQVQQLDTAWYQPHGVFQQQEQVQQQDTAWCQPQGVFQQQEQVQQQDTAWYQPQGVFQQQEQVQQQQDFDFDFDFSIEDINFYLDETCYETSLPLL